MIQNPKGYSRRFFSWPMEDMTLRDLPELTWQMLLLIPLCIFRIKTLQVLTSHSCWSILHLYSSSLIHDLTWHLIPPTPDLMCIPDVWLIKQADGSRHRIPSTEVGRITSSGEQSRCILLPVSLGRADGVWSQVSVSGDIGIQGSQQLVPNCLNIFIFNLKWWFWTWKMVFLALSLLHWFHSSDQLQETNWVGTAVCAFQCKSSGQVNIGWSSEQRNFWYDMPHAMGHSRSFPCVFSHLSNERWGTFWEKCPCNSASHTFSYF